MKGAVIDMKGMRPGRRDDVLIPGGPKARDAGPPSSFFDRNRRGLEVRDDHEVMGPLLTTPRDGTTSRDHRALVVVTGTKPVLVVRVKHSGTLTARLNATEPTNTKEQIADKVFGSLIPGGSDAVNMCSQYLACSHGQLDFQPVANRLRTTLDGAVTDIVDGAVEVTVDNTVDCSNAAVACDTDLYNEANVKLLSAFGTEAENLADLVLYALPGNAFGGLAYAGLGAWYSVYNDE